MATLPFGICWMRNASLSSTSLQSLSTRHGFLGFFSNVHSPQSSTSETFCTAGTVTDAVQLVLRLWSSVAVPVTVIVLPASALVAVTVAEVPLPLTCPPVLVHAYVSGRLSGLVAEMLTVALWLMAIAFGLTEHRAVGGKFGRAFTVKPALHDATLFFFSFSSVADDVTV